MATANPFRFSTKYQDDETGLLYYGYRYYDPSIGRWQSRDPVEENGGANLRCFARNSPIFAIDPLGLSPAGYQSEGSVLYIRDASRIQAFGPPKSKCAGKRVGMFILDVWLDTDPQSSIQDSYPEDYRYITEFFKWNPSALIRFNDPKYITGGIAVAFYKETTCCCKKVEWEQDIKKTISWSADGRFSGNFYVDSPGGIRLFGQNSWTFRLKVKCEGELMAEFNWSLLIDVAVPTRAFLTAPF
jgi:RHS repeat-associated protein